MTANDITNLSFEESLEELEKIVKSLEEGGQPLEESISLYERGSKLRQHCEKKLADAKLKVEKIMVKNNEVTTEEFDPE